MISSTGLDCNQLLNFMQPWEMEGGGKCLYPAVGRFLVNKFAKKSAKDTDKQYNKAFIFLICEICRIDFYRKFVELDDALKKFTWTESQRKRSSSMSIV